MSSKKNQSLDERFLRVQKDPRFWEMPERERKIKIDKRFQSMFHDKRFKVKYTVDKRGRPINHTSTEDLKRFYKVSDSEDEEEEGDKAPEERTEETVGKVKRPGVRGVEADEDDDKAPKSTGTGEREQDSGEEEEDDEDKRQSNEESSSDSVDEEESGVDSDSDSGPDLARGKGNVETSSDEDDEDDVDAILRKEEEEIEHDWGELCKDAKRSEEVSSRLAVCNMDWDRIKAKDLLALLNSFIPKGGAVLSVKVYPSEFGKERLKAEETQGPLELRALPEDSDDDTEEERVYREKMRDYQFKRLKYFYAVVECDSVDTATKIYKECDGYEYESSCSIIDLRFIPDQVQFNEEPADVATDVNLSTFTPKLFTSAASTTSKVKLTWDETDHDRVTAMNRKFNKDELLNMDFKAYLASSSEEEEEDHLAEVEQTEELTTDDEEEEEEEKEEVKEVKQRKEKKEKKKRSEEQISTYRELLRGIQDKEKKEDRDMEMEVTWVPGLRETTEQLVKKKLEGKDKLTPWEEFLEKKKEKKKKKKTHVTWTHLIREDEDELSDDDLPPDVDLSDPFFTEELCYADVKKKKQTGRRRKAEDEGQTAEEEEELERQKAEMALLMEDQGDEARHKHFNYQRIVEQQNLSARKRKKLLKKGDQPLEEDHFQVDVKDPRFQAMFTSHLFNLDPSHPSYKKTRGTKSILSEKQRRREEEQRRREEERLEDQKAAIMTGEGAYRKQREAGKKREHHPDASTAEVTSKKTMDPSLSLLVKSIKGKTERFQARKKQKV